VYRHYEKHWHWAPGRPEKPTPARPIKLTKVLFVALSVALLALRFLLGLRRVWCFTGGELGIDPHKMRAVLDVK
jgi:hypothetical protein